MPENRVFLETVRSGHFSRSTQPLKSLISRVLKGMNAVGHRSHELRPGE